MSKRKEIQPESVANNADATIPEIKCKSFQKTSTGYVLDLNLPDAEERDNSLVQLIQIRQKNGRQKITVVITDGEKSETVDVWVLNYYPWTAYLCDTEL